MTLIVAVPARESVIFGSDTQITAGTVRQRGTKIHQLNTHTIWGASGELAVIQRVAEKLRTLPDQPLFAVRDVLATFIKDSVQTLLQTDFRTQFFANNPEALLRLHPADFLFVECRQDPTILHIPSYGTTEWVVDRTTASGSGSEFAHALLHKYEGMQCACEKAKLLVYKVIEEAINVGAYGLGPPIDIWEVTRQGARRADSNELAGLSDAAKMLRDSEVRMLTDQEPKPSEEPAELPDEARTAEPPATAEPGASSAPAVAT